MTVLSDGEIAWEVAYGDMKIDPYDESRLQPASYDVILDDEFYVLRRGIPREFDLDEGIPEKLLQYHQAESVVIPPGSFALASSLARFKLPDNVTLSVEPRSSAARNGLVTDGWGDPGWDGHITIELYNQTQHGMRVHAGSSYCQFVFERTGRKACSPYDGRYQGQSGVSRAIQDASRKT